MLICKKADGEEIPFHYFLDSYTVNIPECGDLLSVKCGTQTTQISHNCLAHEHETNKTRLLWERNLSKTLKILHKLKKGSKHAKQQLHQSHMLPIAPIFN